MSNTLSLDYSKDNSSILLKIEGIAEFSLDFKDRTSLDVVGGCDWYVACSLTKKEVADLIAALTIIHKEMK